MSVERKEGVTKFETTGIYLLDQGTIQIGLGRLRELVGAQKYQQMLEVCHGQTNVDTLLFLYALGHELGHYLQHLKGEFSEIFGGQPRIGFPKPEIVGKTSWALIARGVVLEKLSPLRSAYQTDLYPKIQILDKLEIPRTIIGSATALYRDQPHEVAADIFANQILLKYQLDRRMTPAVTIGHYDLAIQNPDKIV